MFKDNKTGTPAKFNLAASQREELNIESFENRVCVVMTGLPLANLVKNFEKVLPGGDYTDALMDMRKLGLTHAEIESIPPQHFANISDYKTTLATVGEIVQQAKNVFEPPKPTPLPSGSEKSYMWELIRQKMGKPDSSKP